MTTEPATPAYREESSVAENMRKDSAGRITQAAICYLGVALTSLWPDSGFAAAPVYDPPEGTMGWPLDVVLWKPKFDDPARMLVEAAELLQLAHDLLSNPSSFDDAAPVEDEITRLKRVERHAREVMDALKKHGPGIVPHLMDTDDNSGEYLRRALAGDEPDG